ncbi:MAG: DUF721 family protein [Mycobacterium sp.]|uniref:DUF721 family protein n=1 Tax=Mycobacterium sp. TaxID=1785 RepID=UPI002615AD94|nr:DUF721 family protein [Mycobacterium sp.]MDI3313238.1 DUF721 family protein [Mycobacterium sp.]
MIAGEGEPEVVSGSDQPGMDLVRRALDEARRAARMPRREPDGQRAPMSSGPVAGRGGRRSWSGPGPDPRDPQPLGTAARKLTRNRGWSTRLAAGAVVGQWPAIVGQQIADHAVPTSLRDGTLHITAESTAWATQLRLMQAQLLAKIATAVGEGAVISLKITGPAAPSWRKGPLHISGRGPRDTYG